MCQLKRCKFPDTSGAPRASAHLFSVSRGAAGVVRSTLR